MSSGRPATARGCGSMRQAPPPTPTRLLRCQPPELVYCGRMAGCSFGERGAAVIGTGFIGVVHVEALRRLGVQVHGVVGSSHSRAAERAAALNLPPAYESLARMLGDPRV